MKFEWEGRVDRLAAFDRDSVLSVYLQFDLGGFKTLWKMDYYVIVLTLSIKNIN